MSRVYIQKSDGKKHFARRTTVYKGFALPGKHRLVHGHGTLDSRAFLAHLLLDRCLRVLLDALSNRILDERFQELAVELLERVQYDFHGGSRRQEAQRYGRVMHGETEGEHLILMTDAEYDKYSKRLLSLEEQGIRIIPERRE